MDSEEYKSMRQCRDRYEEMKERFEIQCFKLGSNIQTLARAAFFTLYPQEVDKPQMIKYERRHKWLNSWVGITADFDNILFHFHFGFTDNTGEYESCREIIFTDDMLSPTAAEDYVANWLKDELKIFEEKLNNAAKQNEIALQAAVKTASRLAIEQESFRRIKEQLK